jgi:hypothetical protein
MPCFEEDLADLEILLNRFKFSRVALIGHSDGGKIAFRDSGIERVARGSDSGLIRRRRGRHSAFHLHQ